MVVALRVKPKVGLQEVQPALLHARHPGIAPQGVQIRPFRYMPVLHWHTEETRVKLLATSQVRQDEAEVHLKHPV